MNHGVQGSSHIICRVLFSNEHKSIGPKSRLPYKKMRGSVIKYFNSERKLALIFAQNILIFSNFFVLCFSLSFFKYIINQIPSDTLS